MSSTVPTLADLKTWGSPELTLYLRELYGGQLDADVFHCLQNHRISGPWFLYLREEDYVNWRFTRKEARILAAEARLIVEGRGGRGGDMLAEELNRRAAPARWRQAAADEGGRITDTRE